VFTQIFELILFVDSTVKEILSFKFSAYPLVTSSPNIKILRMSEGAKPDPESGRGPKSLPHWRMIIDQGILTPEIEKWHYHGKGTEDEPYAVTWIDNDPRNPMLFAKWYKWMITITMAFATLAVSLCSSAFSGGM
jgi:hypothetical protein